MQVELISDFNVNLVGRYLGADKSNPSVTVDGASYGQLFQSLQATHVGHAAFIWARPEGVSSHYAALLEGERVHLDDVLADVDQFAALIKRYAAEAKVVLVASFVQARAGRGLGMLDWRVDGHAYVRARMNARLAELLAEVRGVYLLEAQRWVDQAQPQARSARHWYSMKCPFTEVACQAAARDVKAALRASLGLARKLVVVDLDDTMWGGVVGETGWQGLRLGGHDHVGEAFVDFQRALKALTRRGIQVALVSKNEQSVALAAIDQHPEMVLRRADLAGWRINWQDKARNIADLVAELNLGLASVVFIDDNPTERGRVGEALPEVMVPDWPKDPTQYADALRQLDCFDQVAITDEDRRRTEMYVVERERRNQQSSFQSLDEWLMSLAIKVDATPLDSANLKRAAQLLNKTNQLNLRTRRLTESELQAWAEGGTGRSVMTVHVADRFGDLGLTGVISWEVQGDALEVVDYVLSCRAMGRQVEKYLVHLIVSAARQAGLRRVRAQAIPTERNQPCLDFWRQQSGFVESTPEVFEWRVDSAYEKPPAINAGA